MKLAKTVMRLAAVLALALLTLAQARTASAATRYRVVADNLTVRNDEGAFVLGNLFERDHVDVQCRSGKYVYGYAHGDVQRHGFVLMERDTLRKVNARDPDPPRCSRGGIPLEVFMAHGPYRDMDNPERNFPYNRLFKNTITCPAGGPHAGRQSSCDGNRTRLTGSTYLYRNVRAGMAVERHKIYLDVNRLAQDGIEVYWRYVTNDKGHVLVRAKKNGHSYWGFVPFEKIAKFPVDNDCVKRECKRKEKK
ncbi:MAG TPA: hypothetical protein VF591_22555 [Pyrinomonadaceae bacterium]|jgi:hypothetical protein